jgi:beta-fructofuranosidase
LGIVVLRINCVVLFNKVRKRVLVSLVKDGRGWLEQALQKRQQLARDPHRPHYHFLPPNNWMNDPNGLIYWQGQYHMFYQHNPNNPFWGDIHWGHAVSDDLVHWKDLPPALMPDMSPVDDGGCWSGCAFNKNGVPTFFYTGVKNGVQGTCVAIGDAELLHLQKDEANPIEVAPKLPGYNQTQYRDPYVWPEGDRWYQVIGTEVRGRGEVLLYHSRDSRDWDYLHPLIPDDIRSHLTDGADICECPNFFKLGNKHVLIFSVWRNNVLHYPIAFVGEFKDLRFYPEYMQRLDWGQYCFYAPLTFEANNRRLMFGWLQEQRSREEQTEAGWSGVMSLPRVLSVENSRLKTDFAPELQLLRKEKIGLNVVINESRVLEGVKSDRLELQARFTKSTAERSGITLHHGDEKILVYVDWAAKEIVVDTSSNFYRGELAFTERVDLHLFADNSVLELLANREVALTCRVYPKEVGGAVELYSEGGESEVRLEAWKLTSIWD